MSIERFKHDPQQFVSILPGKGDLIFIGIRDRTEFDRIALPCTDHGEDQRGHCLSKSIDAEGVMIVFQYWLKSLTVEAMMEDRKKRLGAARA